MNTYKKMKTPASTPKSRSRVCPFVWAGLVAISLTLGACAPRVDNRGNAILPEDLATIEIGVHTRNNVFETLGSPSSKSEFGGETWYYIYQLTETTAFLAPEIIQRQIAEVRFDANGVVSYVDTVDTEQARNIVPADGETPTAGNTLSFVEQILANIGRFGNTANKK